MNTFTNEIVMRIKEEALNLEGMYTTYDEYIDACDALITHFQMCKRNAELNELEDFDSAK